MGKEKEWTERKSKLTHKLTSVIIECKAAGIPMSSVVERLRGAHNWWIYVNQDWP